MHSSGPNYILSAGINVLDHITAKPDKHLLGVLLRWTLGLAYLKVPILLGTQMLEYYPDISIQGVQTTALQSSSSDPNSVLWYAFLMITKVLNDFYMSIYIFCNIILSGFMLDSLLL